MGGNRLIISTENSMDMTWILTSDYERTLSTLGNLGAEYGQVLRRLVESREDSYQKFKKK